MQVRANGTVSADALRALEDSPLTRRLSGSTDWRASIDVRGRGSAITLESDLVGLASGLPPPFAKTAAAAWPLRIESAPARTADPDARPAKDVLRARLRDDVRVVFERERDPGTQKLLVRRGSFALNAEPILQESGFSVVMAVPEIDFDAWSSVLREADAGASGAQPAPGPEGGFSLLPNFVSVVAERLHVADKDINDVVLGASRFGGFWRANLSSREINGFFNWRAAQPGQPMGTLTARFTRLEIPRSRASDFESLLESTPGALPALDVEADEFVLLDHSLGRLKLRATNSGSAAAPVWTLQQLSVSNPAATLEATGAWQTRRGAPERSTALDFDLELRDAGALLATFGLPDVLRGGAGKLAGSLGWIGSPIALDYPSLGGQMRLDVGRGQFLKTEPGIAKLIGVLNLQSLPRRLTLDFRDVFAEGFAFDAISGDVRIERGIARTDDFRMRGVQAQVVIAGQADIAAETQQLKVEVRPELNAGLASLAYAAVANPALGLGAFVAQMALRKPLQQIFTYEYEVSGSWDDPHVTEKVRPQVAPTGPQVIQ